MVADLKNSFLRDINKLKAEINLYNNEADLWAVKGEVKNSTGTIALHTIGNLNHFIGAQLGNTGYVRERDKEFSERDVPKEKLLKGLDETIAVLEKVFDSLIDLEKEYPIEFLGEKKTTGNVLLILATHLSYHLGQANYLRRML